MFTGLIEETGKITAIQSIPGGKRLKISAGKILSDLKIDDSVAVSGVCLTTVAVSETGFTAEAVGETLEKTLLGSVREGTEVNLERALRLSDRLGGHLVQGHVNGLATITRLDRRGDNWNLEIDLPELLTRDVVSEGSIAVDGISLTVASLHGNKAGISVIPHTFKNTIIRNYRTGGRVNIETDFLAKYIEKLLPVSKKDSEKFSGDWFSKHGY